MDGGGELAGEQVDEVEDVVEVGVADDERCGAEHFQVEQLGSGEHVGNGAAEQHGLRGCGRNVAVGGLGQSGHVPDAVQVSLSDVLVEQRPRLQLGHAGEELVDVGDEQQAGFGAELAGSEGERGGEAGRDLSARCAQPRGVTTTGLVLPSSP